MARIGEQLVELRQMLGANVRRLGAQQERAEAEIHGLRARLLDTLAPDALRRGERLVRRLALPSLLADALILGALLAILAFEARHVAARGGPAPTAAPAARGYQGSVLGALVAFGTLCFSFEGIALVLPIYDSLREPKRFPAVMFACVAITSVVMLLSGLLGSAAFGGETRTIVLLNLPRSPGFAAVQLCYAAAVVLTFPLQLLPAVRVLEAALFAPRAAPVSLAQKAKKSAFRTAYVCLLAAASVLGQTSFDHFVSLIGVACGMPLAFIYPCVCHYQQASSPWQRALDAAIAGLGLAAMAVITAVNVALWVRP